MPALVVVCTLALVVGPATSARTAADPTLTVVVNGPGTVADDAKQISCPGSCQGKYDSKTVVGLTATPDAGATFVGWSGACSGEKCAVDMSKGDQTVVATFATGGGKPATPTLTVAVSGPGRVTDDSGKISCPGTCQAAYDSKAVVGLTATPNAGATFQSWGGACAGTPKCAVDLSKGDQTVSATFTAGTPKPTTTTTTPTPPPEDVCRALRAIDAKRQKIRDRKLPAATAARLDAAVVKAEAPLIPQAVAKDCVIVARTAVAHPVRSKHLFAVSRRLSKPTEHEQGGHPVPLPPDPNGRKSLPSGPQAKAVPFTGGKAGQRGLAGARDTTSPVRVFLRSNLGRPPVTGFPMEPQVAGGGGVLFYSGNRSAAYSIDNGRTFHFIPIADALFPPAEGPFCCDTLVRYVPSIDRFVWLLQYSCANGCGAPPYVNRYRLAVASPAAIRANPDHPERAWVHWDLRRAMFRETSWFDFPDMGVGATNLFLTWDSANVPGSQGHAVSARINLRQIAAGRDLAVGWFTGPAIYWRVAQHARTRGYFIRNTVPEDSHNDDGHVTVYHWEDASGLIFWDTLEHDRIPQFDYRADTPRGAQWNGRDHLDGSAVGSATVRNGELWIAWTAGRSFTDGGTKDWPEPHVYVAIYSLTGLGLDRSLDLWNRSYAILDPGLTVNAEGDVAIAASRGGPDVPPRPVAGLLTGRDSGLLFDVWDSESVAGQGQGDYAEVEPEYPSGTRFITAGYISANRPGVSNEYVFMRFGRSAGDLRPPTVTIDWPREGSSYELGQTVPLRGSAYDEEDGTITGDALIWRLGSLIVGRGTSPEYRPFGLGDQTITLSVADSGRRVGTATLHIHVVPRTGRPTVFIVSPANGTNFPLGPRRFADFEARATDPSGSAPVLRWTDEYTDASGRTVRLEFGAGRTASASLYTIGYSPTPHRITVTATNARGQTAADTITVTSGVYG